MDYNVAVEARAAAEAVAAFIRICVVSEDRLTWKEYGE